jgi:hypothetical protein
VPRSIRNKTRPQRCSNFHSFRIVGHSDNGGQNRPENGVTASSAAFVRVDEGFGWVSDFTLNDALLWNNDSGTAVTFVFAKRFGVRGCGCVHSGRSYW